MTSKDGATFRTLYPMHVIPMNTLLGLRTMLPHGEMLKQGKLVQLTPELGGKVVAVSHQWLGHTEPDPRGEHLTALQRVLRRLIEGKVKTVDDYWLHKVLFRTFSVNPSGWTAKLPDMYVWIDYCCMPQVNPQSSRQELLAAAHAINSIPAYVERSGVLLVLAPVCCHLDTGAVCNYASWRKRGWCRMELLSAILAPREIRVMICTGAEATPFLLHPFDGPRLSAGDGQFSCCSLGHQLNGVQVPCDKAKVRAVLEAMIDSKVRQLRRQGHVAEQRFIGALKQHFLVGLPEAEDGKKLPGRPEPGAAQGLESLRARMDWSESANEHAKKTGFSLALCAALADDAQAVRELAAVGEPGINQGLRHAYPRLAYMFQGATPLMAAMAFGNFETVRALLEGHADPAAKTSGGLDAFMIAGCKSREDNVRAWLAHFPEWRLERNDALIGVNAMALAAVSGLNKAPVLEAMADAGGVLTCKHRWGQESSVLSLICTNEDSDLDALSMLLKKDCFDPNRPWRPHNGIWRALAGAARLRCNLAGGGRPWLEVAMLDGATPLHFAAKRGDVDFVRLLVKHRAETKRNAQGKTPLQVAQAFFGGAVPAILQEELAKAGQAALRPAKDLAEVAKAADAQIDEQELHHHSVPQAVTLAEDMFVHV